MSNNPERTRGDEAGRRLWQAVDAITAPTHRKTHRDEATDDLAELWHTSATHCRVDVHTALVLAYGQIPPLWDQAMWAVFGSEAGDGSGGRSPLRERTPADLDLMETLLTIRESMAWQLPGRGITPKPKIPAQMRQLAAHVVGREPQHVEWWAFRFEQWARLLNNHLNALDQGPKDRYLRNTGCPRCGARQVTIDRDGDPKVVPAIVVDFVGGWIRAASCQGCGHAWFRGDQLGDLAAELETSDTDGMMSA